MEASRPIHLDGLLLAARERRENVLDLSRPLDCVVVQDGVYRASAAFLVAPGLQGAASEPMYRTWRFQLEDTKTLMTFGATRASPASERKLKTANSKYRNGFRRHDLLTGIESLVWQCVGDPAAVLSLAREIRAIGQSAQTGYGEVRSWSLEACDAPDAEAGWVSGGRALRNLPERLIPAGCAVDPAHAPLGEQRAAPPYWDPTARERCWVPTLASLTGDEDLADVVMRGADGMVAAA